MTTNAHQRDAHEGARLNEIEIRIDNRPFLVTAHEMTGAALKSLAGIPDDYQLFQEVPGPEADPGIRDDQGVKLHHGLKFYAVPAGTLG